MEDLCVEFYFFVLVSQIEMLAGGTCDTLLAIELLNGLKATFMGFVVVLNTVELHYPHFILL